MDYPLASAIVALHSRLQTLKTLPRTGWLQRGVAQAESVAEHTYGVATLALLVGDQFPDIDRGRLLTIALLHDMAEVTIGDIPNSARKFFASGVKQEAEYHALVELLGDLPQAEEYLALWREYTRRESREARLVKQLDRLELLQQALAYERAGHRALAEFWKNADEGWSEEFPLVKAMAAELLAERGREQ